ncbi:MAG: DUF3883 domain-containing protein [Bacteroidota bacterium]
MFEFYGIQHPSAAKLLLIAKNAEQDSKLYNELDRFSEGKSMIKLESSELQETVATANPDKEHPVYEFVLENDLEEIILSGGDVDQNSITSKPSLRSINAADFRKAKKSTEINGRRGEEFTNGYLKQLMNSGKITSFNWQSNINPISPFDFSYVDSLGKEIYLDVKSTSGPLENTIHISFNELLQMEGSDRYDLYRVYSISENTAILKFVNNLSEWARTILNILNQLPSEVKSAGVSLKPEVLEFGPEIRLSIENK